MSLSDVKEFHKEEDCKEGTKIGSKIKRNRKVG